MQGHAIQANERYVPDHTFVFLPFVFNTLKQSVYEAPYQKEICKKKKNTLLQQC